MLLLQYGLLAKGWWPEQTLDVIRHLTFPGDCGVLDEAYTGSLLQGIEITFHEEKAWSRPFDNTLLLLFTCFYCLL